MPVAIAGGDVRGSGDGAVATKTNYACARQGTTRNASASTGWVLWACPMPSGFNPADVNDPTPHLNDPTPIRGPSVIAGYRPPHTNRPKATTEP